MTKLSEEMEESETLLLLDKSSNPHDSSSDDKLCDKDEVEEDAIKIAADFLYWKKMALTVSIVSVIFQMSLGVSIFVFAWMQRSPGGQGLAVDAILDVLTTLVVIWRYGCERNGYSKGPEMERRACILIAILFVISGIAINVKATYNLTKEWIPFLKPHIILPIEVTTSAVFAFLMVAKIYIARKLRSQSLLVDGINTGCGLAMALMQLINLLVYHKTDLWFLDSVSALVISVFLFFFGLKLLVSSINCVPIWRSTEK